MNYRNDCANLSFYKSSLKGVGQDYCISFEKDEIDINFILSQTAELFDQLISHFKDKRNIYARLVAKVNLYHINETKDIIEETSYHFPSYSTEKVVNIGEFFERHMLKIGSRLEDFHVRGSNYLIKNIEHIHILLSFS